VTPALRVSGLVKRYGRRKALDGLDLEVPAGSLFGLVGSNGAGKTTLMTVCVGLLRADAGAMDVLGRGPFHPSTHAGLASLLPQDARLPLHSRVSELLHFYAQLQGVPKGERSRQIDELLHWVNLADRRDAPVRSLSHGMMRRLTIAQAFLGNPQLVFLDEPMSGLDPREVARIRSLLVQRRGCQAIVISSHILGELEALCDHVAFVDHGKLVRQDTISAVTRHHHQVTYRLRAGVVPLDRLRGAAPQVEWTLSSDGRLLSARLEDGQDLTELNACCLRLLLDAGVGVEEVRRGSDLESEFLAATEPGRSGLRVPAAPARPATPP
jgi:ABC-2 type transport system ATP-binding protein